MPVVCEDAPAALDRIVLTRARRIGGPPHPYAIRVHTRDQPLHTLRAPPLVCRAIIELDDPPSPVRKALTDRRPPLDDPIHATITGPFGREAIHQQCVRRREKDTTGRHRRLRLTIVVRRLHGDSPFPPTGARADF